MWRYQIPKGRSEVEKRCRGKREQQMSVANFKKRIRGPESKSPTMVANCSERMGNSESRPRV